MDEPLTPVIKETYLSHPPQSGSLAMAILSVAALTALSVCYWFDPGGLAAFLPATSEWVFQRGEYWRLLTSMGIHADLRHLLSNLPGFGILSYLLYGYFGAWVYPAAVLVCGTLVTGLSLRTYPPETILLGASGVVYLMAGFWLTLYFCIERRLSLGMRLVRITGFSLILLVPSALEPQVSYRTHALGFALGALSGAAYFVFRAKEIRGAERIEWE